MVGPYRTTRPSRIGSPVPGISRSASIRSIYRLLPGRPSGGPARSAPAFNTRADQPHKYPEAPFLRPAGARSSAAWRTRPYCSKPCMALVKEMTSRPDKALLGGGTINGQLVPAATAPVPAVGSYGARRAVWGKELDLRSIRQPGPGATTAEQVAGYIAKYATKGTESFGPALDRRIRNPRQLDRVERTLPPHIAAMLRTCWTLGADPPPSPASGCVSGRTCSASGATGRPRAADIPPPWAPCAAPAQAGRPANTATTSSASTRTRTPPRPSWCCASGPTGAMAG